MHSTTEELLKEYDTWKTSRAFSGVRNGPADFVQERRIERVLSALARHLADGEIRYPIEEYLEEEDIDWLQTRKAVAFPMDRAE